MATPREQLAQMLKAARLAAGFKSHGALARVMIVSRPVVSRAENGSQAFPAPAVLAGYAKHTGADLAELTELVERAKSGTPEWFMPYLIAEAEADTIRCWAPLIVPGLLQAEAYARAVLAVEPYTPEQLNELVRARLGRQAVLGRAYITAIIDQRVLQGMIGSPATMAEQGGYLAKLAERPDMALHVLPGGANMGLWGAFDLSTRGGTLTVNLTTIEDIPSQKAELIAKTMQAYERILGSALPRAESLDHIRTMEETWKSRI